MKIIFIILLVIHALIHLLGFIKAFNIDLVSQLTQTISKTNGVIWLVSAILFITTAILFFLQKDSWWITSAVAILISQYLIYTSWHDAKFGTIANTIILLVTFMGYGTWSFTNKYKNEVQNLLNKSSFDENNLLTEGDIQSLPDPVRKYIRFTGAINNQE